MAYIDRVQKLADITVQHIIDISKNELPYACRKQPWTLVNHGVNLLATEDELNAYIAAYGEMHWTKCRASFQNFPFDNLVTNFEIIDWGCGQGIASLSLIEMLKERDKIGLLKKITLIEPSEAALNRAEINIVKATGGSINILPLQRFMPFDKKNDEIEGLDYEYYCVIHLFSNILDIPQIDLGKLAKIVGVNRHKHYIMCMGPKNSGAHRIDQFCNIFDNSEYITNIDTAQYRYTSDTHKSYSCKTKGLMYEDGGLSLQGIKHVAPTMINGEPVYDDYDPKMRQLNGITDEHIEQLNKIFSSILNENDIIYIKPNINGDIPDIVIVRPNIGVLLIDVCDVSSPEKGKDQITASIETINRYWKNLIRHHIKDLGVKAAADSKIWSLVRKMIYFPNFTTEDARKLVKDNYINIIGYNFIEETSPKEFLNKIKFNYTSKDFNKPVLNCFNDIISQGWHSYKQGKHITLTKAQAVLSKSVAKAKQKINGVAGAGKTQVLATRAVNAHLRTGKSVLVLTYNLTLANYVKQRIADVRADFSWNNIVVSNYHQFFGTMANNQYLHRDIYMYDNEKFFDKCSKLIKFSAIFIDEVQDYKPEWLKILYKYFLEEDGEFIVFGDAKQSIYDDRPIGADGYIKIGGVIPGTWNNSLVKSMRFANTNLATMAMGFQHKFFADNEVDNIEMEQTIIFDKCIHYWYVGEQTTVNTIVQNCNWIIKEFGIDNKDVVVLSQYEETLRDVEYEYREQTSLKTSTTFTNKEQYDALKEKYKEQPSYFESELNQSDRNNRVYFNADVNCVKFSTIHSYKGLESKVVILILTPGKKIASINEDNLIYTAITRAKEKLFILNMGNIKYHSFFEKYK